VTTGASASRGPVTIERGRADDPELEPLFAASDAYSAARYPAEGRFGSPAAALGGETVYLAVARVAGSPVGCGAVVPGEGGEFELKRLIVLDRARGRGVGALLLAHLEGAAEASGAISLALETGPLNTEAAALYARMGYESCGPFGAYVEGPHSVFFRKRLRPGAARAPDRPDGGSGVP
jgi:putative acetyltransferase